MVANYCANGANVQFVTNGDAVVGHAVSNAFCRFLTSQLQEFISIPRVVAFLRDRFNGVTTSGCFNTSVGLESLADTIAEANVLGLTGLAPLLTIAFNLLSALPAI
jgi:hypothetical protein